MTEEGPQMSKVVPCAILPIPKNDMAEMYNIGPTPRYKHDVDVTVGKAGFMEKVASPIKSKLQVMGSSVHDLKTNLFRGKSEAYLIKKKEDVGFAFFSLRFVDVGMEMRYICARRAKYQSRLKFGASFTSFFIPLLVIMQVSFKSKDESESWAKFPLVIIFPGIVMCMGVLVSIYFRYFLRHPRMLSVVCLIAQVSALLDTTKAASSVSERNAWVQFIFSLGITSSTGIPFPQSMGVLSLTSLLLVFIAWFRYATDVPTFASTVGSPGTLTVAVVLYSILLGFLAWNWEYEERRDFVLTERLAKENVLVQMTMEMTGWFSGGATSSNSHTEGSVGVLNANCHIDPKDVLVKEELGQGTFGCVYSATWKETQVAVKKIILQGDTRAIITSFGAEASVMAQLRHPNIVMFLGVMIHPNFVGLVMELCPKGSVYSVIHSEEVKVDWSLMLRMLMDASRGMHFLHSNNSPILHRDLKSANLLIDADWRCKVSDFGLSELKAFRGSDSAAMMNRAFIGSSLWIAPEIFRGESNTEKSDVYSFGVILYEAITGSIPYSNIAVDAIPFVVADGKRPTDFEAIMNLENHTFLQEMVVLMKSCWDANQLTRPAFGSIISKIQSILIKCVANEKWDDYIIYPDRKISPSGFFRDDDGLSVREEDLIFECEIGKGVFGVVFKGSYFGTAVAIKKLYVSGVPKNALTEFEKECAIMRGLRHPNIVLFMGSCSKPPTLLLVTELLPNGSFFDIYHKSPRPEPYQQLRIAYNLAFDMAKGLAYLHNHNPVVIHRDLKSQNVLLDDKMKTKIADFGLSKFRDVGKTLSICGSPLWVAPEVLRGEKYGCACDVYSFSIIVWEALGWGEPYPELSSNEIMHGVAEDTLRPVVPEGTPAAFAYLLEECWTKKQNNRPSFSELVPRLEALVRDFSLQSVSL